MPFGIHPEDEDEIKLPGRMPIDKGDYEEFSKGGSFDFYKTQSVEDIKKTILNILRKKNIPVEVRQDIWNSLGNITLNEDIKKEILSILNQDPMGIEDKGKLRKIIKEIS